jgi:hypothetical protein
VGLYLRAESREIALTPSRWEKLLEEHAIKEGDLIGTYRLAPGGGVSWYFANQGLLFFLARQSDKVRGYLEAYLRHVLPDGTIQDFAADLVTRRDPDSHDAYAASFIRLAIAYVWQRRDLDWWRANGGKIKEIGRRNILNQVKANGLVRVFQYPHPNAFGYLMDQCEVYAGAAALATWLEWMGEAEAGRWRNFVTGLGGSIAKLYDERREVWRWHDGEPSFEGRWYPNGVAQIFPHLFGVPEAHRVAERSYQRLTESCPEWWRRSCDAYPWLMVGYYQLAFRGGVLEARAMLGQALALLNRPELRGRLHIGELGYAQAIEDLLAAAGAQAEESQQSEPAEMSWFWDHGDIQRQDVVILKTGSGASGKADPGMRSVFQIEQRR